MSVCVVGGANFDILSYSDDGSFASDSHMGVISFSSGGVGRNIAENLARLSLPTYFLSAVSDDAMGREVLQKTREAGVDCSNVLIAPTANTACYNAILSSEKDLLYAISDMSILSHITPEFIESKKDIIENATICVLDTNISQETIAYILQNITGPKYVVDTVSGTKAKKLKSMLQNIYLIKTNPLELLSLVSECGEVTDIENKANISAESLEEIHDNCRLMISQGVKHLVVSLGEKGLWYESYDIEKEEGIHVELSKNARDKIQILNTTGAGDAMCAGFVYSMYNNYSMQKAVRFGLAASITTIQDEETVSLSITKELLEKIVRSKKYE